VTLIRSWVRASAPLTTRSPLGGRGTRSPREKYVVYIVTDPMSLVLLRGQLEWMEVNGFRVSVITSPGGGFGGCIEPRNRLQIPMTREIAPLRDLRSVVLLTLALRRERPLIVNASTPKAALLGLLAATAARVPARVYVLRGLRLETEAALRKWILRLAEHLCCALAHRVLAVSPSLRAAYLEAGYSRWASKIRVIARGSSNGVDTERFRPAVSDDERRQCRVRLALPEVGPVVGYAGRLTEDKGVADLVRSYRRIRECEPSCRLLLIGPDEMKTAEGRHDLDELLTLAGVSYLGPVDDTAPYLRAIDVVMCPSYREGFSNAALEASASGVPIVGYDSTGVRDAIDHGVTGTLVPRGDLESLADAVVAYLRDPDLRRRHGAAGREMAETQFCPTTIWKALAAVYDEVAGSSCRSEPLPSSW
jgi:glycosyltransferase involved in cell wall biosynthesis